MSSCDLCGQSVQMRGGRYEGRVIKRYGILVCCSCYDANWDGWGPRPEEKLLAHLVAHGLPIPERNAKGWLPRD